MFTRTSATSAIQKLFFYLWWPFKSQQCTSSLFEVEKLSLTLALVDHIGPDARCSVVVETREVWRCPGATRRIIPCGTCEVVDTIDRLVERHTRELRVVEPRRRQRAVRVDHLSKKVGCALAILYKLNIFFHSHNNFMWFALTQLNCTADQTPEDVPDVRHV